MNRFTKIGFDGAPLPADAKQWAAVLDTTTNLLWSAEDIGDNETHKSAEKKLKGLELATHTGWRLPTVEELFCLADRSRTSPAIDTDFFPSCKSDWYWSSSPWAPSPADGAWIVNFSRGYSYGNVRGSWARVRAVRSVPAAGQ